MKVKALNMVYATMGRKELAKKLGYPGASVEGISFESSGHGDGGKFTIHIAFPAAFVGYEKLTPRQKKSVGGDDDEDDEDDEDEDDD